MREIHVVAEYSWAPLWEKRLGADGFLYQEDFDPAELNISPQLANDLNGWAELYDKTLDQRYPPDSGFADREEAIAFARRGIELGKQLQEELGPDFKVVIDFTVEDFEDYVQK